MERKSAVELLKKYVETERVFRHSLAVEAAMIAYAKKFGEDESRWGLVGLLHDIDFEKYPDEHPARAPEILASEGFGKEFIDDILSHGHNIDVSRDTIIRKCLHAVDEMSSFIVAVALMRPTKFEGLGAKSVKKKMKTKSFAQAVNREELISSAEELDIDFNDHVDIIVAGLIEHEKMLNSEGMTLLS